MPQRPKKFSAFLFVLWVSTSLAASDADIQALTDQISQTQFTAYQQAVEKMGLGQYGGPYYNQGTRGRAFNTKFGDLGNQEARKFIAEQFAADGLQPAIQGRYFNIVAEQTGALNPDNILILAAHYDTRKSNDPGGDGDASGVAGVLEAARVLSQYKFDSTIRFVLFNSSEKGFHGSNDYALKILGIGKEKLVGLIDLNQILHPAHDKNPQLPKAVAIGIGAKESAALEWSAAFIAAAQQFVPTLPIDADSPHVDVLSDAYQFVLNGYVQVLRLSENSGKDQANAALQTVGDASDGPAGAGYDYAFATNVVRAAVATLAQQAGYEGTAALPPSADSDGDGYSDAIETALLSDPADPLSTPSDLPPAANSGALETLGMTVGLDFSNTSSDAVAASGYLPVPAGFVPKGSTVIINLGGIVKAIKLAAEGAGTKANNTFSLHIKLKNGAAPAAQYAPFTFSLGSGNFKRAMAVYGLLNSNRGQKPVTIPLSIIFNNQVYSTARVLLYAATKDANGVAR